MSNFEWGRNEYVTQLNAQEVEEQNKVTEVSAFTNEAFSQLMDWFEWSDPIADELWKRFAQINEQLNQDRNETTWYASNEMLKLADSMEVNKTEIELSNRLTLLRFKNQFDNQYQMTA